MATARPVRALVRDDLALGRAAAVTSRNTTLVRSGAYGWLLASGLAEPLLYLLSLGWGLGCFVGTIPIENGRPVDYLTFVAPAMLASSAMSGALAETTINFFAKLRYLKQYEPVLNTPLTPAEVACGELGYAVLRGVLYSSAFLVILVGTGITGPLRALVALPAAVVVGCALGALGLAITTFMRSWDDFQYVGVVQFALFLFSGTFAPVTSYPQIVQIVIRCTPLYHGVALIRGITLGSADWALAGHAVYLVVLAVTALVVAARRMRTLFRV